MTQGRGPGRPLGGSREGSRTARHRSARRQRIAEIAVALVIGGLAFAYASNQAGNLGTPPPETPGGGAQHAARLLALSVTGAPSPFLAVVGSGGAPPPATLVLPPRVTVTVPGQGQATTDAIADLPAPSLQVAVSNALGAWAAHVAVLDLNHLGQLIDGAGGIEVRLPARVVVGGTPLGPGAAEMDGDTAITFLYTASEGQAAGRWASVLRGLLVDPPTVVDGDLSETDDLAGSAAILSDAAGARVAVATVKLVAGTIRVPDQPAFDAQIGHLFGTPRPARAIVENGSGAAGVGEAVARAIIPVGFRVVLSRNAPTFDHDSTLVVAEGADHVDDAKRARRALGVGKVGLSQVPSGIGDITIVVGKDFAA